jgi:hypothetical protein
VAEVTLRSVFSPVQIGMTILAVAPYMGEHRIDVTLFAPDPGMQTT